MKRKTYLMVGLFLAATLAVGSFSAVTLAWIVRTSAIDGIRVDASSLGLNLNDQKLYKYVFPRYKDSSGNETNVVDYLSKGEVKAVSNDANMNPLDPTYLNIQHLLSQEGIGVLNTNLVLEFDFTIIYTTSIDLYIYAERDYVNQFIKSSDTAQRVSDFIHFDCFSESEISGYLDDPLDNEVFSGDGSTTSYELISNPSGIASITIDGTPTNAYTRDGKTITFNSAPANHSEIIINYSTIWHAVKYASEHKASASGSKTDTFTADGTNKKFTTSLYPQSITSVTVGSAAAEYTYSGQDITLNSIPAADAEVAITYSYSKTHDIFPYKQNKMVMTDRNLVPNRPTEETTSTFKFYLNIEYDYDLVSSETIFNFFAPLNLGNTYNLDKDFRLIFGVKQGAK